MKITIWEIVNAPRKERFRAFWGDDYNNTDVWGSGKDVEAAVRDLIDNYDIPTWNGYANIFA